MAFQTIITREGEECIITLKNLADNTFAEIYAFGALLNKFSAQRNGEDINVVEGFLNPREARETITSYFKSAKLSPFACRVSEGKYTFGKNNFQLKKNHSDTNAIHGLMYNRVFYVNKEHSDEESAAVTLEYTYNNIEKGYPFCFKCLVEYKLTVANSLTVTTTITNTDNQLIPLADGWHPYFTLGDTIDNYQLEFQSKEILEFDENLIPTGKLLPYQEFDSLKNLDTTSFDNCFTLNFAECQPLCVIRNPARKVQIEFYPSPSYPYLQIYTPEHRRSLAVENLSAAPDAFNNGLGLKVLEPGESAVFSATFSIRFL